MSSKACLMGLYKLKYIFRIIYVGSDAGFVFNDMNTTLLKNKAIKSYFFTKTLHLYFQ